MKKLFAGIITAAMVLSVGMTAFAAESITDKKDGKEIDVQAKAVYTLPEHMASSAIKDGKADVIATDGAKITVSADGNLLDGFTLNVIEMAPSDKDAYAWISGVMKDATDQFTAYDIYFTDQQGNRVPMNGSVTVTITTPDGYTSPKTYFIGTDGNIKAVESKQSEGNTVFAASSFGYYAIADQADDDGGTTNPSKPSKPSNSHLPQTGDTSNMALWIALLLVSGGILTTLGESKKRGRD